MDSFYMFFLMSLAAWRGTRLIVTDHLPFVRVPREWALAWLDPRDDNNQPTQRIGKSGKPQEPPLGAFGRSVAYLLTCPWCMSFWVAGGVVWAAAKYGSVPLPVLVWGALWGAASWLAACEGWAEERWRLTRNRRWQVRKELGLPYLDESEQ